ncbi:MAG: cytochrome c biogenesis heme-transporting ATPase CcmA [Rubrivivax sp.]
MPPSHPPSIPADAASRRAAPLLEAVDLGGDRGGRRLFRHLNLQLRPGQVVWLRGRNGRGKTSLLRLLAGLATPVAGRVQVDGVVLRQSGPGWRQRLHHIGHPNALKDDLSVAESLRFFAALQGRRFDNAEGRAALGRLGIEPLAAAAVGTLSQGQRRRVALARLALSLSEPQPSVWLLDEPFDALDEDGIRRLNSLLTDHARRGGSTLLTSHQALSLTDPAPWVFDLDDTAAVATLAPLR